MERSSIESIDLSALTPAQRTELEALTEELEFRQIFGLTVDPETGQYIHDPTQERPWLKFLELVVTHDEHDEDQPFKPLVQPGSTIEEELPYAVPLIDLYLVELLLAVSKSRQIRITWILSAMDLYQAMRPPGGKRIGLTAQKEVTACELLDRCWTIYRHLPEWLRKRIPLDLASGNKRPSQTRMKFLQGSSVSAFPEGSEQFRSYTFSVWRNEEAKTQLNLPLTIRSAMPTLKGGGRCVQVSTPGPGAFKDIVFDRDLKSHKPADPDRVFPRASRENPISIWKNPGNGYVVIEIHYTADPAKRSPEAEAHFRQGISNDDFEQEYNLNYEIVSGEIALQFYVDRKDEILVDRLPDHLSDDGLTPHSHLDHYASGDYGIRSPYVCLSAVEDPYDGTLYIFDEYYRGSYTPLPTHLSAVKALPWFEQFIVYILDKSCFAVTQQVSYSVEGQTLHGVRSIADQHQEEGVHPIPARVVFDAVKVSAMQKCWAVGTITVKIVAPRCPDLCRELEGIRWKEKPIDAPQSPRTDKLVDRDNHAWDALTYLVLHRRPEAKGKPAPQVQLTDAQRQSMEKMQAFSDRILGQAKLQASYLDEEEFDEDVIVLSEDDYTWID